MGDNADPVAMLRAITGQTRTMIVTIMIATALQRHFCIAVVGDACWDASSTDVKGTLTWSQPFVPVELAFGEPRSLGACLSIFCVKFAHYISSFLKEDIYMYILLG